MQSKTLIACLVLFWVLALQTEQNRLPGFKNKRSERRQLRARSQGWSKTGDNADNDGRRQQKRFGNDPTVVKAVAREQDDFAVDEEKFDASGSGEIPWEEQEDMCYFVQIPPIDHSLLKDDTKLKKVGNLAFDMMKEFNEYCANNYCDQYMLWCYGDKAVEIAENETMQMLNKTELDICGSGPECYVDKELVDHFYEFCAYPDEWWEPELDEDSSLLEVAEVVVEKLGKEFEWCEQNGCHQYELACKLAYVFDEIKFKLGEYCMNEAWSKCYDELAICNGGEEPEEEDWEDWDDDWESDDIECPNEYMEVDKDMSLEDFAVEAVNSITPEMECSECWDTDCFVEEIFDKIVYSFVEATLIDVLVKNWDSNDFCKIFENEDIDWDNYDYDSECKDLPILHGLKDPEIALEVTEDTTIEEIENAIEERLEVNNQRCKDAENGKCSQKQSVCLVSLMYEQTIEKSFEEISDSGEFWNYFYNVFWDSYWYYFWMYTFYFYDPDYCLYYPDYCDFGTDSYSDYPNYNYEYICYLFPEYCYDDGYNYPADPYDHPYYYDPDFCYYYPDYCEYGADSYADYPVYYDEYFCYWYPDYCYGEETSYPVDNYNNSPYFYDPYFCDYYPEYCTYGAASHYDYPLFYDYYFCDYYPVYCYYLFYDDGDWKKKRSSKKDN